MFTHTKRKLHFTLKLTYDNDTDNEFQFEYL